MIGSGSSALAAALVSTPAWTHIRVLIIWPVELIDDVT